MKKTILVVLTAVFLGVFISAVYVTATLNSPYAYLFVYFEGNEDMRADGTRPTEEAFFYAVSTDGYNFTSLNDNTPVLTTSVGTGGIRDPFIMRTEDGDFVMLATDMHARNGWRSNYAIVTLRSKDLINWEEETLIPLAGKYRTLENSSAAWAPQAIFDKEKGEYLVYFSSDKPQPNSNQKCIYAFYTKDFKTLSTEPFAFFEIDGEDVIDADIVFDDGVYYMFYRAHEAVGIDVVSSTSLSGTFSRTRRALDIMCEGSNAYKLINSDTWLVMADLFWGGWWGVNYVIAETEDFTSFTALHMTGGYSLPFTPRHGYVMQITRGEYYRLMNEYRNTY